MLLIDTDVLIIAANRHDDRHVTAKACVERLINGGGTVIFASASLVGFVRTVTRAIRGLPQLTLGEAFGVIDLLLARPRVQLAVPDALHFSRVRELLEGAGAGGRHVDDAHLAALALQYSATIVSFDRGFARFPGIKWESPAA